MTGRLGRTRRSRVYDCNFDMGAQYYKSALDRLDQKNAPKVVETDRFESRPKFKVDDLMMEDDLAAARRRAEKVITEDSVLDTRSGRFFKSDKEDDFDEEVQSSLNRIRAMKKSINMSNGHDIDDTVTTVKRHTRMDFGDKADNEMSSQNMRARALKIVANAENYNGDASSLTKWTAVDADSINSLAAQRAKATKARLDDIESDMYERSEKQAAREKRAINLRKMLAENDIETSYKMVHTKTEKHVSF